MHLYFRDWMESSESEVEYPEEMGSFWYNNLPGESFCNDSAVELFAFMMASPEANAVAIAKVADNLSVDEIRYPESPISNNLLTIEHQRLRTAIGHVTTKKPACFSFFIKGENAGKIIIRHPPVLYGRTVSEHPGDQTMMEGILRHELGHAVDWLRREQIIGEHQWRGEQYERNLMEARQYAGQLRFLMKKAGGYDRVIDYLKNSAFRIQRNLLPVVEVFLRHYQMQNEAFNPVFGTTAQPAMVIYEREEAARDISRAVVKIIDLFEIKNFIVPSTVKPQTSVQLVGQEHFTS